MNDGKWRSRKQIVKALGLKHSKDRNRTRCVSSYLLRLIRSGHIVRANAPNVLKQDPLNHVQYVYKATGKKYVRPPTITESKLKSLKRTR